MRRSFLVAYALAACLYAAPAHAQPTTGLTLEEALRQAERASEAIAVARADVDRARVQVVSARSGYLPTLNGSAAYQRTLRSEFEDISFGQPGMAEEDVDLPFGQRNNWRFGLVVSQPLFDGFRTSAAIAQAKSGVQITQLGVQATRAQVALDVAQAYYDAALAQRQLEIAEETLRQAAHTYADTKLNFEQGAAPEFDLVRAEVARDNQSTLVVQFRAQRDVAFVQLRRLIGAPLDRQLALVTPLEDDDVEQVIATVRASAGLPASATRVAVAQAREGVAISEAAVRGAKADRLPIISAGSDLGFVNYESQPFNDRWRTNWTAGVTLTLPIFDGFRRRAAIAGASAELAASRAALANTSEVSQVEQAQVGADVTASLTTLETSRRTVKQARRAYQIAELLFEQGRSTHIELVDARVQLEQALLVLARASRNVRVARIRQELLPGLPLGAGPTYIAPGVQ